MKKLFNDNWQFKLSTDNDWQNVTIPHDWLIYDTSKLYESGEGQYKKNFTVSAEGLRQRHSIIFDGVYMDSAVFVNGKEVGQWKYGYTAFCFNISEYLKEGGNEILVTVNHQAPNTRWYSGAGIYRNIYLNVQGDSTGAGIVNDGVYISSKKLGNSWELSVKTEIFGDFDECKHILLDSNGIIAASFIGEAVTLNDVKLWDTINPHVYRLRTEIIKNGEVLDCEENPVGFRTLEFSPDKGFFLNGRYMKMHGVCLHHDLGALGAAYNVEASRRQCQIMQDMGVNAIRVSHNPPAREFLDLCDELGILVIDEFSDIWENPKNKNDYARFFPEWHKKDVASWVRRDRNHPSVIMWSIGNEIYDTHKDERGLEVAKILCAEVLKHDPDGNAKSTIGSNFMPWENAQKVADALKLAGYNYAENLYDSHHEKYPDWFIYGSETVSSVRSRGIYRFPIELPNLTFEDIQCSDLGNSVVGWGATMEKAWLEDRDRPWVGGQFIWTGIDYIGEPTPYWTKNSYFGAVDTAGLPKAAFYFYRSVWNKKAEPWIKLFPHWDWNEGQIIDVIAYSNMGEAELFLNNKSLGKQQIDHEKGNVLHFAWKVPYEKGELLIKAYKNGVEAASDIKKSFFEVTSVVLEIDENVSSGVSFIRVYAVDGVSTFIENARNRVYFETQGNTKLLGLDNGDSTDYDSYKGDNRRLFGGQLVAIIDGDPKQVKAVIKGETPLRKIELKADRLTLDKDNPKTQITADLLPANADFKDITWKCVLDTGATAEFAVITVDGSLATVEAFGDGIFKVRATCRNGSQYPQIVSELNFEARGIGSWSKNAFTFISASQYDISDTPLKIIEQGSVAGVNKMLTKIGFKNVDFKTVSTDLLRLYIGTTSYFDEVLVDFEVDGKLTEALSFPRNNLHYSFEPHEFRLKEKLTGKHDICFTVDRRCVFGGFEFVDERVFNAIYAGENDEMYGDDYTKNGQKIENIGNNVIIKFNGFNFGNKSCWHIIMNGFAPKGNTVQLRITQEGREERTALIEFPQSDDYTELEFYMGEVIGVADMSFVFLPGSDFNLDWFKFR